MHELLIQAAYEGGLIVHFGVKKTLETLHEHLFWPNIKHDIERVYSR